MAQISSSIHNSAQDYLSQKLNRFSLSWLNLEGWISLDTRILCVDFPSFRILPWGCYFNNRTSLLEGFHRFSESLSMTRRCQCQCFTHYTFGKGFVLTTLPTGASTVTSAPHALKLAKQQQVQHLNGRVIFITSYKILWFRRFFFWKRSTVMTISDFHSSKVSKKFAKIITYRSIT